MRTRAASLASALLLMGVPAAAQQVAVAAAVPVAAPTGGGIRDLSFGVVAPIMGQTIAVDVPAAPVPSSGTVYSGEFRYDVTSVRGLDFVLTVPVALVGPGVQPLAVTFDGLQYGGWCVTSGGSACTPASFNPATAANVRVCAQLLGSGTCHPNRFFPPGSELGVHVGGLLSVPATARAGLYTGMITLTIVQVY